MTNDRRATAKSTFAIDGVSCSEQALWYKNVQLFASTFDVKNQRSTNLQNARLLKNC